MQPDEPQPEPPSDTLGLGADEMRRLGYWVVDAVVEHFERSGTRPPIRIGSQQELAVSLGGPLPEDPGDPEEALRTLVQSVFAHMQHGDHPRFFARVPGPSSFAGVLGDWLSTGFNALVASWAGASGPTMVELVVLDWLRELLGLPEGTEGVLLSGGSMANITGLAAAREACGPGVAYLCDQTHSSIPRGLSALGFPAEHRRVLASDESYRLSAQAVSAAVAEDRAAGRRPGFVIATAGTTNCGAIDDLPALAELCGREGMWLHVDGAYGAPAALCDSGRAALVGLERADSLVLDPHKWLFQPYDIGCLLVRRPGALARAFAMTPEYLADITAVPGGEVDLRDRTLELTRRARAVKLWLSFRTYGVARFRAAIARGIELAQYAQRLLEADERWEVVTPAQLAVITFARRGAGRDHPARQAAALAEGGYAAVSTTVLHGRSVLRLCTINPRTTEEEIAATLERLVGDGKGPGDGADPLGR